jgi:hypothetical protein
LSKWGFVGDPALAGISFCRPHHKVLLVGVCALFTDQNGVAQANNAVVFLRLGDDFSLAKLLLKLDDATFEKGLFPACLFELGILDELAFAKGVMQSRGHFLATDCGEKR